MTGLPGVYGDEAVVTCTEGWLILSGHRTQTIVCGRTGRWTTLGLTTLEQCSGVILVHNIADANYSHVLSSIYTANLVGLQNIYY